MNQNKVGMWIFVAAATLSLIAAFIPLLKGDPMNVVFLGTGVVFFVIAAAGARKARGQKHEGSV